MNFQPNYSAQTAQYPNPTKTFGVKLYSPLEDHSYQIDTEEKNGLQPKKREELNYSIKMYRDDNIEHYEGLIKSNYLTNSPFIYVIPEKEEEKTFIFHTNLSTQTFLEKNISAQFPPISFDEEYLEFEHLFRPTNLIYIPKKAEYNLRKYVSKKLLSSIHHKEEVAIELCLQFLSNLAPTFYYEDRNWRALSSTILHQQSQLTKKTEWIYLKIIELLLIGTTKGAFIDNPLPHREGFYSKRYKLADSYLKAGCIPYLIKSQEILDNRSKLFKYEFSRALKNPIGRDIIRVTPLITFPTRNQIDTEALRLVNNCYIKKGKRLKFLGKHSKSEYDLTKTVFVEDHIKIFEYLTNKGPMIPHIGDEKSGGRVYDSLNMMPSWIRSLILIDGKPIKENDFSALHPNLTQTIFEGDEKFITHQKVADELNVNVNEVKIEHLSFFNKTEYNMRKSPLFNYYKEKNPILLNKILVDKEKNGYRNTSKLLFKKEVELMTLIIERLNQRNILVLYVFDALICKEEDYIITKEIMNNTALELGIYTEVK